MRTITSAKYEPPTFDASKQMIRLIRKGFARPEWVEAVKYVDRERNFATFLHASDLCQKKL